MSENPQKWLIKKTKPIDLDTPSTPDQVLLDDKAEITQVGRHSVIGEIHTRHSIDKENQQLFEDQVSASDVVFVESGTLTESKEETFSQQAKQMSIAQGKELIVLDKEIGMDLSNLNSVRECLARSGADFSDWELAYLGANLLMGATHRIFPVAEVDVLSQTYIDQAKNILNEDTAYQLVTEVAVDLIKQHSNEQLANNLTQLEEKYFKLLTVVREKGWNEIIRKKVGDSDQKATVVVGKAHQHAVISALSQHEYPVSDQEIEEMAKEIQSLLNEVTTDPDDFTNQRERDNNG